MYHVSALFLKAPVNCAICRYSVITYFSSHVDSHTNQCHLGSSSPSYRGICADAWPMSNSMSISPPGGGDGGGGGGGGSGMFCLSLCAELLLMELSFPSVIFFVISSLTNNRFKSTSPVDVQLHWFVCRSDCSVFSKAVFDRGVLLHVSGKLSGYFGWKGTPEVWPSFLPLVDRSLYDYHHLPRRLVDSIYQNHHILVLGLLQQWIVSWYSNSLETEVLSPRELLFGEIHTALSTSLVPWVMLLHPRLLPVGHDPTLADFFLVCPPVIHSSLQCYSPFSSFFPSF